jgi:hypothetical protein
MVTISIKGTVLSPSLWNIVPLNNSNQAQDFESASRFGWLGNVNVIVHGVYWW